MSNMSRLLKGLVLEDTVNKIVELTQKKRTKKLFGLLL